MTDQAQQPGPPPPPPEDKSPYDPSWVIYDRALGPGMGDLMEVTIRDKGDVSSVFLTANLPPEQDMGFFRTVLPEEEVNRIKDLVRVSDYLRYGHKGAMRPDTPVTILRQGDDVSTFIPDSPPPASVTAVFDALETAAKEIVKHPFKGLRGKASWTPQEVKSGDPVELGVSLRSIGSELIIIDNPLGSDSRDWTGLTLVISKDKPAEELDWEKDVKHIQLVPHDLLTHEGKLAKGQNRRIELPPGTELRLIARRKLLLPAGRYTGQLFFIGGDNVADGRVVGGQLSMALGPLTVRR